MNGGKNDSATKECTRIVVGVIGVIFVVSSYQALNLISARRLMIRVSSPGNRHLFALARRASELQPRAEPSQHS